MSAVLVEPPKDWPMPVSRPAVLERSPHTRTPVLLMALRNWHPSHDELIDVLTALVQRVNFSDNALNSKCRASVVDQLLVSVADVEDDRLKQVEEQEWRENKRYPA